MDDRDFERRLRRAADPLGGDDRPQLLPYLGYEGEETVCARCQGSMPPLAEHRDERGPLLWWFVVVRNGSETSDPRCNARAVCAGCVTLEEGVGCATRRLVAIERDLRAAERNSDALRAVELRARARNAAGVALALVGQTGATGGYAPLAERGTDGLRGGGAGVLALLESGADGPLSVR